MTFTIHKQPFVPREIRFGRTVAPEPENKNTGRKKMAEEKKLGHETGVEKISQERADKQGPVGTNAPAPSREQQPAEDVKIGNKGDEKDA